MKYLPKLTAAIIIIFFLVCAFGKPLPDAKTHETYYETEEATTEAPTEAETEEPTTEEVTTEEPTTEETTTEETTTEFVALDVPLSYDLQVGIKELCDRYEFSYEFFIGWMYAESGCRWVIGASNDTGYMQIIPRFHQAYAESKGIDIFTELGNCEYALLIINEYLNECGGDLKKALQKYNTGDYNTDNGYAEWVFENVGRYQ